MKNQIIYEHPPPKRKHECGIPTDSVCIKSLARCEVCGSVWVVGWVQEGFYSLFAPGWKKLRWWHIPSQLRLRRIRKEQTA